MYGGFFCYVNVWFGEFGYCIFVKFFGRCKGKGVVVGKKERIVGWVWEYELLWYKVFVVVFSSGRGRCIFD